MRRFLTLCVALTALLAPVLLLRPAMAVDIEVPNRDVKRRVLALYDAREEKKPHLTRVHRFAEMPLNWLGYTVEYQDIGGKLPELAELQKYRAILTWFQEPMTASGRVARFINAAVGSGLRYVVLGEVLPTKADADGPLVAQLHNNLGLTYTGLYASLTFGAKVAERNAAMVGFERPLDTVIPEHPVNAVLDDRTAVHLSITTKHRDGVQTAPVVVTSPRGGYAASSFSVYYEAATERTMWTLNPFQFFKLSLGEQRFPVPDTTTLSGRRIYFSHIDGDGWNNVSEIEGFKEAQILSSEVIAGEAIERYPDLPVSVALISGDVSPLLGGTLQAARVAKRLFALPQVEVASHTHTHPFDWSFFSNYQRADEETKIDAARRPLQPVLDRVAGALLGMAGRKPALGQNDKYIAVSDDLPRSYMREPFDLQREVVGSIKLIEQLAPAGKKAKLYQWSGDTTPFEAALRATRAAGVRNINGGDSRLDSEFPSITYLAPVGRQEGKERQIYSGNSNENTYTNDWTGPYYGFFMLGQTLDNTDAPRRLKPFNLYYHMYSGEKTAALAAIKLFLERARTTNVIPIPASEYAAIADDFYGVAIQQTGLFTWTIAKRGAVQTMRFDEADALGLDIATSTGVLGANRHNGALYVTLDPAVEPAVITLRSRDGEAVAYDVPKTELQLGLIDSRWRLSKRDVKPCQASFTAEGFGPSEMTLRATPERRVRIVAERNGTVLATQTATADAAGLLEFNLAVDARNPLTLRFDCAE